MYKNFIFSILLAAILGLPLALDAQFAPEAGQPGTTAIHADSSVFVAWATGCVTQRGPIKMGMDSLASMGHDSLVPGVPGGIYDIVCLGDGGVSTVTFASPIYNGPGPDFAVFENGFHNTPHVFLELAFVEVSSDGENFFRFPAVTNVPETPQVGSFTTMDATLIHNFAGKYEAFYGTPFDLDEVPDDPLLDKNNITHVRVIDVVGCIDPQYCTYDSQGHIVNDPWPTPFNSSGFDLDAVGVIHDLDHYVPEINLVAVVDSVDVSLTWNEPSIAPEQYIITRNGEEITTTSELEYLDEDLPDGTYTYCIVAVYPTMQSEPVCQTVVVFIDGIMETETVFSVIPNPFRNVLKVKTDTETRVMVLNATGQVVVETVISQEEDIDMSCFNTGVYFVVMTNEQKTETKKVIKL